MKQDKKERFKEWKREQEMVQGEEKESVKLESVDTEFGTCFPQ